jgi:hypothetical protein
MFPTAKLALIVCAIATASPALAADRRVYKIDSVIATLKGSALVIQAKGAVQSGGWRNPRLRVLHSDGHAVTVELVALAPPPGMTVIEALVPVTATAGIKAHGGVTLVRALAEANEITTQILH